MAGSNGNAKWQTWAAFGGTGILLLGALVSFAVSIANLRSDLDNGRIRIADLEVRLLAANNRYTDTITQVATIQRDLREIETQFCGVARDINRMHIDELRTVALLWQKTYNQPYPLSAAYFAEYGKCQ